MIYVLLFTLTGLALVLAIGSGLNELSRLNGEVELEKTRQSAPVEIEAALQSAESRERELISATLQSQVSSMLKDADSELKYVSDNDHTENRNITQAAKLLKQIKAQLEDLSTSKCSYGLKAHGLEAALRCMVSEYGSESLRVEMSSSIGDQRLGPKSENHLFMACAELIQNTIKHSNASVCKISLFQRGGAICLRVVDNGVNPVAYTYKPGFGLASLKTKSERLGGNFHFSLTAFGAECELNVPLYSSRMIITAR